MGGPEQWRRELSPCREPVGGVAGTFQAYGPRGSVPVAVPSSPSAPRDELPGEPTVRGPTGGRGPPRPTPPAGGVAAGAAVVPLGLTRGPWGAVQLTPAPVCPVGSPRPIRPSGGPRAR